ncbi:MAG: hypothetical protein JWM80_1737 [Cyanobacteria bacterium RYN_339]|nr:hypothetical protein [Cyanobacteria bacterium RYN_339]
MPSPDLSAIAKIVPAQAGTPAAAVQAKPTPTPVPQPKDQLVVSARPAKPAAAAKATAAQQADKKTSVGAGLRLGAFVSFFTSALTTWLFDPHLFFNHVKTLFTQTYRLATGGKQVYGWAKGIKTAKADGSIGSHLLKPFQAVGRLIGRVAVMAKNKVLGLFGKGAATTAAKGATSVATRAAVNVVKNRGLFGWYNAARAGGAGRMSAIWQGFTRTLETGGDMQNITAHAATMGGNWGKAFAAFGKVARLAPLLNVPISILDLMHAHQILNDANANHRMRVAKIGQAYFSTFAAGLSIAAFLVPAPLDLLALKLASFAGFGSLGWSVLSSKYAVNFFAKVGNFLHIGGHHELEA